MEVWAGSAEEPGILQRHAQGCVERSRGLGYPNLPLSTPTGVQLVEAVFCLVRFDGVLRSSHQIWVSGIMLMVERDRPAPGSHVGLRGAQAERRTRDGRTHRGGDIHYQNWSSSASPCNHRVRGFDGHSSFQGSTHG